MRFIKSILLILLIILPFVVIGQPTITLILPVKCQLMKDCFLHTYFDHGPGKSQRDFMGGILVSESHNGVDVGLATYHEMAKNIEVIAAADGQVIATRDGVADNYTSRVIYDKKASCGNGLAIQHQDGWITYYCHLKQGSVKVNPKQQVTQGQLLGYIGTSGRSNIPHLHFIVEKNKQFIDPFVADLWQTDIPYHPYGVMTMGIASQYQSARDSLRFPQYLPVLHYQHIAMVAWIRGFGLLKGDQQRFIFYQPNGEMYQSPIMETIRRDKRHVFFVGGFPILDLDVRLPTGQWRVVYQVKRGQGDWETLREVSFQLQQTP